jgi:hypothetical protein
VLPFATLMIGTLSVVAIAKAIIIIAAVLGVLFIVLRVSGVQVPPWVWQIVGIMFLAFVAIVAIEFLASL